MVIDYLKELVALDFGGPFFRGPPMLHPIPSHASTLIELSLIWILYSLVIIGFHQFAPYIAIKLWEP